MARSHQARQRRLQISNSDLANFNRLANLATRQCLVRSNFCRFFALTCSLQSALPLLFQDKTGNVLAIGPETFSEGTNGHEKPARLKISAL